MINDLLADLEPDPGIFYSGCVVAEIRDLRPGGRPARPRHVLLRPSAQSLICDSQAMARAPGHARWTSEDRANLESQVVLATEGPLCLDPSPVVSLLAAKAHHARHKFATVPLRRATIKRYSQAGQNRKRKLESLAAPSELRLHDFIRSANFLCNDDIMLTCSLKPGVNGQTRPPRHQGQLQESERFHLWRACEPTRRRPRPRCDLQNLEACQLLPVSLAV